MMSLGIPDTERQLDYAHVPVTMKFIGHFSWSCLRSLVFK